MKVLISPDSFKGSIDALNAAKAIESGIHKVDSTVETELLPMADGGEGTMINLVQATNGTIKTINSRDPLNREMKADYGITGDGQTAIIELATSSGIDLLSADELNPYVTTTYGTGLLIKDALEKGIKHFIICLGGSATNDAGVGILQALGYRFLDKNKQEIKFGGIHLKDIESIDESQVLTNLKDAHFDIACDVTNVFVGKQGASHIFGPQKGATYEQVIELDHALNHFSHVVEKDKNIFIKEIEGAGAAGGTAGGLMAFLNTNIERGIELVIDFVNFHDLIRTQNFDYIFTGEGKIDGQTAGGKVISGICKVASDYNIPVIAIGGSVESDLSELHNQGLTAAFSITTKPVSLEYAIKNAQSLIEQQSEQIFRLIYRK